MNKHLILLLLLQLLKGEKDLPPREDPFLADLMPQGPLLNEDHPSMLHGMLSEPLTGL